MRDEWGGLEFTCMHEEKGMKQKHPDKKLFSHIHSCSMDDMTYGETFKIHMAITKLVENNGWNNEIEEEVMKRLSEITKLIEEKQFTHELAKEK